MAVAKNWPGPAAGATGIQVGSVFALSEESGNKSAFRSAILAELKKERTIPNWC